MYSQYFFGNVVQTTSQACILSATPPTFAGVVSTTPATDGSISAAWAAGSTTKTPLEYEVYISLGSVNAATLFQTVNKVLISPNSATSQKIFTLADNTTYLVKGSQYTVGVRAKDALGYTDSNTVLSTPTAIASGNLPAVFQALADSLIATDATLAATAADLVAVELDLSSVAVDMAATEVDLAATAADLVLVEADLAATAVDLGNLSSGLSATASIISGGAGTQMTFETYETVITIEDGV